MDQRPAVPSSPLAAPELTENADAMREARLFPFVADLSGCRERDLVDVEAAGWLCRQLLARGKIRACIVQFYCGNQVVAEMRLLRRTRPANLPLRQDLVDEDGFPEDAKARLLVVPVASASAAETGECTTWRLATPLTPAQGEPQLLVAREIDGTWYEATAVIDRRFVPAGNKKENATP